MRADGIVFTIPPENGPESITDQEGNRVTYGDDGIIHDSGERIALTRDNDA